MWQINCFTRSYRSECRLCQCAKVATKKLDVFKSVLLGDMQEIYSETDSDGTTTEEDEKQQNYERFSRHRLFHKWRKEVDH